MRLSDEKITDIKEYLNRSIKVTASSLIPQLSKYGIDLIDTIEALQQENEQLRAHVARMRGMLFELNEIAKDYAPWGNRYNGKGIGDIIQSADKLLDANTVQAYHNPADVEALRKAREAINGYSTCPYCWGVNGHAKGCKFYEALQNIDVLIGGKEDV